jgi:hypothetical protein
MTMVNVCLVSLNGRGLHTLIHILRLHDSLQVIFQDLCEIVYQRQQLPLWGDVYIILCSSEPRKYFKISSQSGGLS